MTTSGRVEISDLQQTPELQQTRIAKGTNLWPFFVLFFFSGFPALLYQIVWERALFTVYGVNVESVTVIVTVFMLGLGLGSLAGGKLSAIPRVKALRAFGIIELSLAIAGVFSLPALQSVASFTAGRSVLITGAATFVLLLVPTALMGSTLPLLVQHLVHRNGNVGKSVGSLYAVNTFGSGVACLMAAIVLMGRLGESGVVHVAASMNFLVGATALIRSFGRTTTQTSDESESSRPAYEGAPQTLPMSIGVLLAAASGFIALGYEIVWYRAWSFASAGAAPTFAKLLGFYLLGVGYGSVAVRDACRGKLKSDLDRLLRATSSIIAIGAVVAFMVVPVMARLVSSAGIPLDVTYPLVFVGAALLGAVFPLLSHASIDPRHHAGKKISYLYLSNIIGSCLGSFLIGFVVMDYLSIRSTTVLLLALGCLISLAPGLIAKRPNKVILLISVLTCLLFAFLSRPIFADLYERLFLKARYARSYHFRDIVENRSGVITVDSDEFVYGGGVYDGQFNVDPVTGNNQIFRAYAIPAFQPHPRQVLAIGLSSGSWAQILANYSEVQEMTIVEINPGYLQLIRRRPAIAGLLHNPKVHIVIDDGRRWLVAHPDRKFDFILMNTTFNWRANASNLLSVEFMQILKQHLNPGGAAYYNTTSSGEVQLTGATVFPGALRVSNFLVVGDHPIIFDRERCRQVLLAFTLNGRRVFDIANPDSRDALDHIISLPFHVEEEAEGHLDHSIEDRASLLRRLNGKRLITDDNMGNEWP